MNRDNYPHRVVTKALTMREYRAAVRWCMENITRPAAVHSHRAFYKQPEYVRVWRFFSQRLLLAVGAEAIAREDSAQRRSPSFNRSLPRAFYFRSLDDAVLFQIKYS